VYKKPPYISYTFEVTVLANQTKMSLQIGHLEILFGFLVHAAGLLNSFLFLTFPPSYLSELLQFLLICSAPSFPLWTTLEGPSLEK